MTKIYKIYKITNLTNKKVYIGQTHKEYVWASEAQKSKKTTKYCRYTTKIEKHNTSEDFRNDIAKNLEKLGNRNIKTEILEDNILTEKEADEREIYWIAQYNTRDERFGYNSRDGGKHGSHNEKSIKKRINTVINNGTFRGKNNPNYGKNGEKNPRARKIICVTTGEVFNCVNDAKRKYNIGNICKCCRGKLNYAGKLNGKKLVWCYLEDYNNEYKGILRAGN